MTIGVKSHCHSRENGNPVFFFLFFFIFFIPLGCSHTSMTGDRFTRSALGDDSVKAATAYAVVQDADTRSVTSREQLARMRELFSWCKAEKLPNCHLIMMGGWGGYGFGTNPGWWWPDTFQSDGTYYQTY